jgi:hypothetical protein
MTARLLLAAFSAALLLTAPLTADDGAIEGVGGAIELLDEHPSVVMEEMVVDAYLCPEREAQVDCRFTFRNGGEAVSVRMGFPELASGDVSRDALQGFTSFCTWVDGRPVEARIEGFKGIPGGWQRWRVKELWFEAGESRQVRVRYTMAMGRDIMRNRFFEYRVGTGRSWKGSIGRAQVRLHLLYNPSHWLPRLDERLREVGANVYQWGERSFDPEPNGTIVARFEPIPLTLVVNGEARGGLYPVYPEFHADHFWVSVRHISWSEATVQLPGALIVRGTNVLQFRAGRAWVERNGEQLPLPVAPFLHGSDLYVPFAVVRRLLGQHVEYRPTARSVIVTDPILAEMESLLSRKHTAAIISFLGWRLPGWAPAERQLLAAETVPERTGPGGAPWLATGDFDGDALTDVALSLCKGSQVGVVVLHTPASLVYSYDDPYWLEQSGERPQESRRGVLATRAPGEVAYYADNEPTPKSGRLQLQHDAIEIFDGGKSATLHYWHNGSYRSVLTAD